MIEILKLNRIIRKLIEINIMIVLDFVYAQLRLKYMLFYREGKEIWM